MCYPSGTQSSTSAEALATYLAFKASKPAKTKAYEYLYAHENASFLPYKSGAVATLVEAGFTSDAKCVEYDIDNTSFTVIYDRAGDKILQVNNTSGKTRRLIRREALTLEQRVFELPLPHKKREAEAEIKRLEELRVANLASIPAPVYSTLTWTVESTDVNRPHPFRFAEAGQAALESKYQSFLNGGFHLYVSDHYLIDFKAMTQTNHDSGSVRKLERVEPSASASSTPASTTTLSWTVESTDVNRPHPFAYKSEGVAALESAYQSFLNGGSHHFVSGLYLIDFSAMTQTNDETNTVRKLERTETFAASTTSSTVTWSADSMDVNNPQPFVYEHKMQAIIELAYQAFLNGGLIRSMISGKQGLYFFNFRTMEQIDYNTDSAIRKLKRVESSSSSPASSL